MVDWYLSWVASCPYFAHWWYSLTIVYSLTINLKEITLWDSLHTAKIVKNKNRSQLKCFIRKKETSLLWSWKICSITKKCLFLKLKKKCKKIIWSESWFIYNKHGWIMPFYILNLQNLIGWMSLQLKVP